MRCLEAVTCRLVAESLLSFVDGADEETTSECLKRDASRSSLNQKSETGAFKQRCDRPGQDWMWWIVNGHPYSGNVSSIVVL